MAKKSRKAYDGAFRPSRKSRSLSATEKKFIKSTDKALHEVCRSLDVPLEVVVAIRGGTAVPKGM